MLVDPYGVDGTNPKNDQAPTPPHAPMTMPGPAEQTAQEIADLGVEGRPADPKSGPALLWSELGAALGVVICLTGILAWTVGWAAGVAALAISLIALVLNPVVSATLIRAHDRQEVVRRHDGDTTQSDQKAGSDTGNSGST